MAATTDWYSKKDASAISVIAVLLMIWHHFFGFRSYLIEDVGWESLLVISGIEIERVIAAFGKICVSLFAFNSGYVLWKFRESAVIPKTRLRRGAVFLLSYWIIVTAFMAYAFATEEPIPDAKSFLWTLFGLKTGPGMGYVNVSFAWYVAYYLTFLLLSGLLVKIFSKGPIIILVAFIAIGILLQKISVDFLNPLLVGIEGILFARFGLFEKMQKVTGEIKAPILIIVALLLVVVRQGVILIGLTEFNKWGGVDILVVPVFIFVTVNLHRKIKNIYYDSAITFLATYSMNLWFIHGIFFSGNCLLQPVVYMTKIPVIIYLTGLFLTLVFSILIYKLQKIVLTFSRLR